jgi:hypothetical protein
VDAVGDPSCTLTQQLAVSPQGVVRLDFIFGPQCSVGGNTLPQTITLTSAAFVGCDVGEGFISNWPSPTPQLLRKAPASDTFLLNYPSAQFEAPNVERSASWQLVCFAQVRAWV